MRFVPEPSATWTLLRNDLHCALCMCANKSKLIVLGGNSRGLSIERCALVVLIFFQTLI